jgi:DNA-binding transcriptional regulator YiaG
MAETLSDFEALVTARRELPSPERCKQIRVRANVSLGEVAEPLDVTRAAVAAWESGRSQPSPAHVVGYLRLLRIMAGDEPL